jgi:tetratricopeptide (TPR) repeat protein/DNA-binding SARP family transcriptional activator
MTEPGPLSPERIAAITDPEVLLIEAWALEPWMRFADRSALLDRLEDLLGSGVAQPPPGRDWRLELLAERAVDAGRERRHDEAQAMTELVLSQAGPDQHIARGRAQLAAGQSLAWTTTDAAATRSDRAFAEATEHFSAIGNREWQGSALLRRGYSLWFQGVGYFPRAAELLREALDTWDPSSKRLTSAYVCYAEVLIDLGQLDAAEQALDEAGRLAERDGVDKALGEITATRALVAAGRGDARATERLLREALREAARHEWFDTHIGTSYFLYAAEVLDRLGLANQALEYFDQARARAGDDDAEVRQTRASMLARGGDPLEALDALQELVRQDWLEKRLVWRHLVLTAWATFRAGREGAAELAARALEQAVASGGVRIAQVGEPELTPALAALAEQAGSAVALDMLLDGRRLLVRLFGTPTVRRPDGTTIALPPGKPAELVRMLALDEIGLPVEVVLHQFFPDVPVNSGRARLRQILNRLRTAAGEIVVRDGDHLRLVPSWVDVREYISATDRIRSSSGSLAVQRAYAALALRSGPLLPTDRYAAWADEARSRIDYRHLELLDLVAADAKRRGSHQEALTALDAALAEEPDQTDRYLAVAEHLIALGRDRTAAYLAARIRTG